MTVHLVTDSPGLVGDVAIQRRIVIATQAAAAARPTVLATESVLQVTSPATFPE